MNETATAMHGEAAGVAPRGTAKCDACLGAFTRRKPWQRFCGSKCRNDWHGWTKTAREARELVRLALEGCDPQAWNPRARKLLGIK